MNRRVTAVIIGAAALCLGMASAHSGPCSSKIAQFEQAVRQSAGNPSAGPMAPQSIGAQLDRQPTPGSVKRAEERAQATFEAAFGARQSAQSGLSLRRAGFASLLLVP
jgi:hypothetical protein